MSASQSGQSNYSRPRTQRDWHLWHVANDPDFLAALKGLQQLKAENTEPVTTQQTQQQLADDYHLSAKEFGYLELGQFLHLNHNAQTASLSWDKTSMTGTITFDLLNTTKAEVKEQFSAIEELRRIWGIKQSRRRPPGRPSLIYAIFKARQQNMTYRQIYEYYSSGTLPGYKGYSCQFVDEETLERYYRRYQP